MATTETLKDGTIVLQPELPIFEDHEEQEAKTLESSIAQQIARGIEAGLRAGSVDTRIILEADLAKLLAFLKANSAARYGAVDWQERAKAIADSNLATLTIFQSAINFAIACGKSKGAPDFLIEAADLRYCFEREFRYLP